MWLTLADSRWSYNIASFEKTELNVISIASDIDYWKALIVYFGIVAELIKKAICEFNPPENITCPESQMIEVVNANYGRKDKWTCGEQLAENDRCL